VRDTDVICTASTARDPVVTDAAVKPGTHINAIGGNMVTRRELDDEAIAKCSIIAVDNREQAQQESGELIHAVAQGAIGWNDVGELGEIVSGKKSGRGSDESITLFKSLGVAMEDVALASRIYERAVERKLGMEIPLTE
jgi:ornithine cyclodeaminase/alanine dehydrogenase-like protein (mu-crystallin family)